VYFLKMLFGSQPWPKPLALVQARYVVSILIAILTYDSRVTQQSTT